MYVYNVAALDPRRTPQADEHNNKVLAGPVLGIEVTVPALAGRCSLGNIDPQHLGGDTSRAAIDAALTWPLPPLNATLATVRPDADSIGAMALLSMRAEAHTGYDDHWVDTVYALSSGRTVMGVAAWDRATLISRTDREASGPWPGPRPIGGPEDLLRETTALEAMCMDHTLTMAERVVRMRDWLLSGKFEGMAGYQARALAEAQAALADLDVQVRGGVAVVTGAHRLAMSIGYRHAPVVVATNPRFRWQGGPEHVKHTVARWNTMTVGMDWDRMLAELQSADPGWGGSASIVGSPQGIASRLTTEQVVEIVARHAEPGE